MYKKMYLGVLKAVLCYFSLIVLVGCGNVESVTDNSTSIEQTDNAEVEDIAIQQSNDDKNNAEPDKINEGMYKVGSDIDAGEYILFVNDESYGGGYYSISTDSNKSDIIVNDNFDYNQIIRVEDGDYLEFVRCYAIPYKKDIEIDTTKSQGMYKVGDSIVEGEYKLEMVDSNTDGGYYAIYDDSRQVNIIANNNFDNTQYVTVKNGDYLYLNRCKIVGMTEISDTTEPAESSEDNSKLEDDNSYGKTYQVYKKISNLTVYDLKYEDGDYFYDDIRLLTEDKEWIDNIINKDHGVRQGAIFKKMAMCLEGFDMGNTYTSYDNHIFGFDASSREELEPYVKNAMEFIVTDDILFFSALMNKFKTMSSISDYSDDNHIYSFNIPDLTLCAEELGISEEMLGYIFGELECFAPDMKFEGNSCQFYLDRSKFE